MNAIKGDTSRQKAVAIALYLKKKLDRSSTVNNYTPYKIHKITKIHPRTFQKYLPLMQDMGLVSFYGKNNEHLVVNRMHSKYKGRNIDVHQFHLSSFNKAYRSVRAAIALLLQQRKDYVLRTLQIARHPKKGDDFKTARKTVRRLVRRGVLKKANEEPTEYGMSFKRIAKEIGVCMRTAEKVINDAVRWRWCRKVRHFHRTSMPGVNRMPVHGYLFTTINYGFNVDANTYVLSPVTQRCLGMVS